MQDFKKTTKVTWLADTEQAPLVSVVCVHFDSLISKGVLDKNEDFKDFINKHSKVVPVMHEKSELGNIGTIPKFHA